ncbi:hypothetical protein IWT25_00810 [Secundilactobacillus pentosiphilus]|uniref:Uncharacterized protein n=1 Tax=Secundilactobacillus pentosiphilus TaxID=1714682 RepID=A0A1Z5IUQ0_9LACO|nr:helveticin J family class III bacteriocin [Secundilactobacillus pentosiphilus]GAX05504.1 hypothetical protein IWT25_00810 [Secundilactobacillus pentosiphilus]
MQPTLAYKIQGLGKQSPVTAFCFDHQMCYVAQTIKQDTVITRCDLGDSKAVATADKITLQNFVNVHSLALFQSAPKLDLVVCGQPIGVNGQVTAPELWYVAVDADSQEDQPRIFKITHLESANITGTPLPAPVIGAVSALSSDHNELTVMVLDKAQHLQCSVYNMQQVSQMIWQMIEADKAAIEAGDFDMMANVYQSFKPTAKQLAPDTIGSIQSIAFSNGRAIYATKSYGAQQQVSKGFWLLKNGFHDQSIDGLTADTSLTGIALFGKYVYFGVVQKSNDSYSNTIHRVEKTLWK